MKADELREAYLSFFESKDHVRCPSDSLVPANDPTLLFTGAGMNQFKEMFLGVGNLPFTRAATAQKCFRTGDLENVGKTYYHHTFFEMLGNFSFGDYFKKEAIEWAWEFITGVLKLPEKKLRVSVYEEDDEAHAIWKDVVGLPEKKIWRLGAKDNFWPADAPAVGPNGPCGPCSEIFYDYGSPGKQGDPEAERYCEFWNLVFTQFNRVGEHELEPLSQTNIDTGLGFERTLAILNGVRSNFETDLFLPLIRRTAELARTKYVFESEPGSLMRRIADHARAATFLIADGVKPGNEGRGYVVRRVVRRAIRDGIALGIDEPFLHELAPLVVSNMGRAYPELLTAQDAARAFLLAEEDKFRETYHTGIELLERAIAKLDSKVLPGETAFVLYDTHGFPLELCEEILKERGLGVDHEGFARCMQEQRERSREGSTMSGEVFVATAITSIKKSVEPSEFVGYERDEAESSARVLIAGEQAVERLTADDGGTRIIAAATPFYAESGGQIGDRGTIEGRNGVFRVEDTQNVEGYVVHYGRVEQGAFERDEPITLRVDAQRRDEIRRNHSATHLLHAALREILGRHVTQAGSLVAPGRLRFDFTHPKAVLRDEIAAIERWVNDRILANDEVTTERMALEDARKAGAMALFGEKYDDVVRVVRIGERSLELCGGTHVGRASEIGACLLTQEGSVASGVRRIEMVTGGGALELTRRQRSTLRGLSESLRTAPDQLQARIEGLVRELKELKRLRSEQKKASGAKSIEGLLGQAKQAAGISIVVGRVEGDPRTAADALRAELNECALLLASPGTEGVSLFAAATDGAIRAGIRAGDVLRGFAAPLGGKGGGRPQSAQGHLPSADGLDEALDAARDGLLAAVASR